MKVALQSTNLMDKWILAAMSGLAEFMHQEMEAYRLYTVVPRLVRFIEELTNWYVRLNRKRLKGSGGESDSVMALSCLFYAILNLVKLMAPFTPFFTEYIYQNLRHLLPAEEDEESVHFQRVPMPVKEALDPDMLRAVGRMQAVIELGRTARERKVLPIKLPLSELVVINSDPQYHKDLQSLEMYICDELNVRKIKYETNSTGVVWVARPDLLKLGKRLKKEQGPVTMEIREWGQEKIAELMSKGQLDVQGHTIALDDVLLSRDFTGDKTVYEPAHTHTDFVLLNVKIDPSMEREKKAKEIVNRVQKLRKNASIFQTDAIEIFYATPSTELQTVISEFRELIQTALGKHFVPLHQQHKTCKAEIIGKVEEVDSEPITLSVCRQLVLLDEQQLLSACDNKPEIAAAARAYLYSWEYQVLLDTLKRGPLSFVINGIPVQVALGKQVLERSSQNNNNKN